MKITDRIVRLLKSFLPVLLFHIVIAVTAGAVIITYSYGTDEVRQYYQPLLIAAGLSLLPALLAYHFFFGNDAKYSSSKLGEFDRNMLMQFGVRYERQLREAIIDMHCFDFNTALDKYEELFEKQLADNQKVVLSFYTGRCYQLMGYPANAVKHFETCLELGMKLNDVYLLAARCLTQNGRFDDAIEYYSVLIERESYFEFIYTDIGLAYLKKGDGEKALEYFRKSVDEGMNYSFALGGCSLACLQMKDLEKSNEYFKEAVRCSMEDVNGFKVYYCSIAESVGLLNEIDENMKINTDTMKELVR